MDINDFLPPAPQVEPETVTAKPAKKKPSPGNLLESPEKPESVEISDPVKAIHEFADESDTMDPETCLAFAEGAFGDHSTDNEDQLSRPLYELVEDYHQLVDYLVGRDGVMDEESMAAWSGIRGSIDEKIENCGKMLRELELREEATNAEKARLTRRAGTLVNGHKHLKEYVKAQLLELNRLKFEGKTLNFTVYENGHSCDVYDEARVPDEFCTVTVKMTAAEWRKVEPAVIAIIGRSDLPVDRAASKTAIIAAWKQGAGVEQIPGSIVEKRNSIRVY